MTRTSMALDGGTLLALKDLAERWGISKAEVMRRAVKRAKDEADREGPPRDPLQALDWLQNGGGMRVQEAEAFREAVSAERQAQRYWWEA